MVSRFTVKNKFLSILCFLVLYFVPLFSLKAEVIECEVIETSPVYKCNISELNGTKWLLIHHLHIKDRKRLSDWLKTNSGKQVIFIKDKKKVSGILFRVSNCFGRGLLIYKADITAHKHDVIRLLLP